MKQPDDAPLPMGMPAGGRPPLTIERIPIDSVAPHPRNPREGDVGAIARSLAMEEGQYRPIVVQARTPSGEDRGIVLAGNHTWKAAKALAWTDIDAVLLTISDEAALAVMLRDNQSHELGRNDDMALFALLRELDAAGALSRTMFDGSDIDDLLRDLEKNGEDPLGRMAPVDVDAIPEPPDVAITQPGNIWVMGEHRLMCGDSGSPADLDRLLAGAVMDLLLTDPPYNVKVEPRSNNAIAAGLSSFQASGGHHSSDGYEGAQGHDGLSHHQSFDLARGKSKARGTGKMRAKDRPLTNDFVSDEAFLELLAAWFGNASRVLRPGGGFYIWGGYANIANYPAAIKAAGFYFSQAIIWDKEHPVLTRKDFMGAHEWAFYGWKEGAAHRFFGPANIPDLWHVKKVAPNAMVHLTEKPVELSRLAIEYSTRLGENVLDLFAGSGSTMMACEVAKRRGYMMEMDPPYCDVIVKRWEDFTGHKAVLEEAP